MSLNRPSLLALWASAVMMPLTAAAAAPEVAPAEIAGKADESLLVDLSRAGDRLLAIGSRGHILISDDQAETWQQVAVPVNNLLTAAYFVDDQRGWVVGHDATILVTEDGGLTWAVRHFDASMEPLLDVTFFDDQRGLAIGAFGLAMETTDGGANWSLLESDLTADGMHLNAVAQLNDGGYLVVGEGGLMAHSVDQGQTWTMLDSPYESSLFSVAPMGDGGAIIGGLRGNAFATGDVAGGQWRELQTGTVQSVFGITDDGAGGFWMAGLNGSLLHADADLNIEPADTRAVNGLDDTLIATAIGGVAYADVLTLGDDLLVVVGDAGVRRMTFSR